MKDVIGLLISALAGTIIVKVTTQVMTGGIPLPPKSKYYIDLFFYHFMTRVYFFGMAIVTPVLFMFYIVIAPEYNVMPKQAALWSVWAVGLFCTYLLQVMKKGMKRPIKTW